jgi:hypothetical protein
MQKSERNCGKTAPEGVSPDHILLIASKMRGPKSPASRIASVGLPAKTAAAKAAPDIPLGYGGAPRSIRLND